VAVSKEEKERLRTLTVEAILDLRSEYLRTPGCNVMKHWDQIADRLRAAARSSASPEEWCTAMRRSLQLSSPSKASSASCFELVSVVTEGNQASDWLTLLEAEWGYLMASARLISDKRKEARLDAENEVAGEGAANPFDKWTVKENS